VVTALQSVTDRLSGAVGQHEAAIIPEESIAQRRFYADARRAPREHEGRHAQVFQKGIQVGFEEAAEPMLDHDQVALLRRQFRQNVRVPGVLDENTAFLSVGRRDWLANAQPEMQDAVGRFRSARVREVAGKRHFQIDHGHPGAASDVEDARGRGHSSLDSRNVDTCPGKHAAFGSEVVLHVDDNDRGPVRIDVQRMRLGLN
jgi:hypothetical protein